MSLLKLLQTNNYSLILQNAGLLEMQSLLASSIIENITNKRETSKLEPMVSMVVLTSTHFISYLWLKIRINK